MVCSVSVYERIFNISAQNARYKTTIPWFRSRCVLHLPPPYYAVHPLSALTSADLPAYRSFASCWKKTPRGAHRCCDAAAATGRGPRSGDDSRVPVRATNQVSGRRQCHPFLLVIPSRLVGLVDGTLRCTGCSHYHITTSFTAHVTSDQDRTRLSAYIIYI